MNKKGYFDPFKVGIFFVVLLLLCWIIIMVGIVWSQFGEECKQIEFDKLISVDGRYDKDTGLLAGGSVREKTLLFEEGLVITLNSYSKVSGELRIGNYYYVMKCEDNGGTIWYKLK